jgi:hypothetical protein
MMNRSVMGRQMFAKGGAAFPDLSGDGKVTQKDILMGRGVVPMADGGEVPGDVRAIFQGLVESMRGSKDKVAAYVRENSRDLSDIAKMYPNMAAMINEGFKVMSEVSPARAPMGGLDEDAPGVVRGPDGRVTDYFPPEYRQEEPLFEEMPPSQPSEQEMNSFLNNMRRSEELGRPDDPVPVVPVAPPEGVYMQTGGEPMAAAMEQGAMPADPMAAMAAPSPADLGSMDAAGIASQMDPEVVAIMQGAANNFGDPEQAESLEGMMDAVRGTRATEEERREELAGVVGPEDAAATPDSVLAMVQPLMLLMGAQGAMETEVDTGGIGPMAQDTMNVPVSGDMAGGIMQMAAGPPPEGGVPPVNFSQGGEVLRFNQAGAVPGYDVNPAALGKLPMGLSESRFPINPSLDTLRAAGNIDRMARSPAPAPAPAPAAKSSSVPDFGPTAAARLQQYKALMGDTGAEEDKDLAQAQFFQDLAKFGFSLMQAPKVGENPLAQAGRAALETGLGQNTLNLMAKQKAAQRAADRGLKLASITTTETEISAARKAENDRQAAIAAAKAKERIASQKRTAQNKQDWRKHKAGVEGKSSFFDVTQPDGSTVRYQTMTRIQGTSGKPLTEGQWDFDTVTVTEPVMQDNKLVVTGRPKGTPIQIERADGSKIGARSMPDGKVNFLIGPGGGNVITSRPDFKYETRKLEDGTTQVSLVNQKTGAVKKGAGPDGEPHSYTLSGEYGTTTVKGAFGEDIILQFARNADNSIVPGSYTPVYKGKGPTRLQEINGGLYQLKANENGDFEYKSVIPGDPDIKALADGRLAFVYPPDEANPRGRQVIMEGAVGKPDQFDFATFVNSRTQDVFTLRRKKGEKSWTDLRTGQVVPDSVQAGYIDISGETAYDSSQKAKQRKKRRDIYQQTVLERLGDQFQNQFQSDRQIEAYVDRTFGSELNNVADPTQRATRRQLHIDNIEALRDGRGLGNEGRATFFQAGRERDHFRNALSISEAVRSGTGAYARVKSIFGRVAGTVAAVGTLGFYQPTVFRELEESRNYVRAFATLYRIAAANSPRFAEGEQSRLALLLPDVDSLLTSGKIELGKLRIFKDSLQSELVNIRRKLADGDLEKAVTTQLQNAEIAIENALVMMPDVLPPGTRASRTSATQSEIDALRQQQGD